MASTILVLCFRAGTFGLSMRITLLTLLLLSAVPLSAQDDIRLFKPSTPTADSIAQHSMSLHANNDLPPSSLSSDSVPPGIVTVVETDPIKALMADYAAHKRPLDGYRVQIFLGDRATAESTRRTFLQQHPDMPAYLSYLAPNFRVRVGDLRDRVEAENLREELQSAFPGLYVVPDQIEPPQLSGSDN